MRHLLALFAILIQLISVTLASGELRTWRSVDGVQKVEAEYIDSKDGQVYLKRANGKQITVPLEKLSPGDQQFVKNLVAAAPALAPTKKESANANARIDPVVASRKPRGIAYLAVPSTWGQWSGQSVDRSILAREIVRQAALLAARDQGFVTRDAVLEQHDPPGGATVKLEIVTVPGTPSLVEIGSTDNNGRPEIHRFPFAPEENRVSYKKLLNEMELAVADKFPPLWLRKGAPAVPRPLQAHAKVQAEVQAEVEALLEEMNLISQFLSIRRLHALVNEQGESPEVLAALVRGYSNLAVLTSFLWHPSSEVFKARALLYAERLVHQCRSDAMSLRHRAYAYALIGQHAAALADLKQAEASAPRGAIAPPWTSQIESLCKYSTSAPRGTGPGTQLAHLIHFMDCNLGGGSREIYNAGVAALRVMPDNNFVVHHLIQASGVSANHNLTINSLLLGTNNFVEKLRKAPGLPSKARELVDRYKDTATTDEGIKLDFQQRRELIDALSNADDSLTGDSSELSWPVLGQLLRELSFLQVRYRASFLHNSLGVSADDFLDSTSVLYKGHRFAFYLDSFRSQQEKRANAVVLLANLPERNLQFRELPMVAELDYLPQYDRARKHLIDLIRSNSDEVVEDYLWMFAVTPDIAAARDARCILARAMLEVSPYSPRARNVLIRDDWEHSESQIPKWAADGGRNLNVWYATAQKYIELKRFKDAERCLLQLPPESRSPPVYSLLADVYRRLGDEEKWLQSLQAALAFPDIGLNSSRINTEIAGYYMQRRRWKEALPFALKAAETGSANGMLTAASCYEATLDWRRAEELQQATALRYENLQMIWWEYCIRTGRGDKVSAQRLAEQFAKRYANSPTSSMLVFYDATGSTDRCIECVHKLGEAGDVVTQLLCALYAQQLGDVAERQRSLMLIFQRPDEPVDSPFPKLANMMRQQWDGNQLSTLDEIDKLRPPYDPDTNSIDLAWFDYYVGKYLMLRGNRADAVKAWSRCLDNPNILALPRSLAGMEMLRLGIGADAYGKRLQTPIVVPKPASQ